MHIVTIGIHLFIKHTVSLCTDGRAYRNAHFGVGSGPIFLDDVQCTSSASQLLECPSRPILSHNCLHSADAGVGCEGIAVQRYLKLFTNLIVSFIYSSLHNWSATTGRRQCGK